MLDKSPFCNFCLRVFFLTALKQTTVELCRLFCIGVQLDAHIKRITQTAGDWKWHAEKETLT